MMKRKQGMTETIELAPVDQIFSIFREYGSRHYGENVSELEQWRLQTAEFARQFGEADSIVLSCLLHDYGQMSHDLGGDIAQHGIHAKHEIIGAMLLKDLFPEIILEPFDNTSPQKDTYAGRILSMMQGFPNHRGLVCSCRADQ